MLKAIEYEILRGVPSDSRVCIPLPRQPVRIATLLNEAAFAQDQYMIHLRSVHLEDQMHDWNWRDGQLRFYARKNDVSDVLVVYAEADIEPPVRFDPMTGEPVAAI